MFNTILCKSRLWVVGGESWRALAAPAPGAAQLWSNSRTGHSWHQRLSSVVTSNKVSAATGVMWAAILEASVTSSDNIMRALSCDARRCRESESQFLFLEQNILCVQSKHRCGHSPPWLSSPHYSNRCQFSDVFGNISGIIELLNGFVVRQVIKHKNCNKGWIIAPNPNMAGVLTIPKWCSGLAWKLFILFNLFIVWSKWTY